MLDLLQALAAAPGIDHRPSGQEYIRVVLGQRGERFVVIAATARAMFGVPGDRDGQGVVAAEILGDLAIRPRGKLAFEHALRGRHERGAGLHIGRVHRMNMDVDGAQGGSSFRARSPAIRPNGEHRAIEHSRAG